MLLLTDEKIRSIMSVRDCLEVMESAYRELAEGSAVEVPRQRMYVDDQKNEILYWMGRTCGALPRLGIAALRVTSTRRALRAASQGRVAREPRDHHLVLLFSLEQGELLAILQGFTLSGIRLGATTAVATKYLARIGAAELGILGSGKQARANLEGIAAVTQINRVKVYSPNRSHRTLFCEEMGRRVGIAVDPVEGPREALKGSDIVLCASNAWEPIFDGNWIEEGALVISLRNSDGQKTPREFDETIIKRSSRIVVCSKEQIRFYNQRELLDPIEKGLTSWEKVYELADLVVGRGPKREASKDIIFYHSNTGMGIQFAAVGSRALQMARDAGVGLNLPSELFYTDLTPWFEQGYRPTS